MVSRGRCRFGRFDLSRVPAGKRSAALGLQVAEWSPFTEFDHAVVWAPSGHATVWCWDLSGLREAWQSATRQRMPPAIPESALRPPPATGSGTRLLKMSEGFEAQVWQGGELVTSRWWPALPSEADARMFLRDAGLAVADAGRWQNAQDAPLMRRPWAPLTKAGLSRGSGGLGESAAYAALLVSLVVPAAYLSMEHWRVHQAQAQVSAELQRESERSKAVLDARNEALSAADQARALIELQPFPPPLMHMSVLATELPPADAAALREWEMSDGKLRLLFESAAGEIAGAELVSALERTALFDDVKIVTQANPRQMALQMTLRKRTTLGQTVSAAGKPPAR
jgi:hypothetical protein